jgi:hypothetical protein
LLPLEDLSLLDFVLQYHFGLERNPPMKVLLVFADWIALHGGHLPALVASNQLQAPLVEHLASLAAVQNLIIKKEQTIHQETSIWKEEGN